MLFHPGFSFALLVVLIFLGGLAKGIARRSSDGTRYVIVAIYIGTLLGGVLAAVTLNAWPHLLR